MKTIRQVLKKSDTILGLRSDIWKLQRIIFRKTSPRLIKRYIRSSQIKKLQIGAGPLAIPGWLGTDLWPTDTVAFLDATKSFPIDSKTFDYIHNEHMIEHISWFDGLNMLRECYRILKPGGKIRVATPDLQVFVNLYQSTKGSFAEKYMKWHTDLYLQGMPAYKPGFLVNAIFIRWGHQFVYDGELLEMALREAGFTDMKRFSPGESEDINLQSIEMHGRIGNYREDMNEFETMVFEGRRPA